MEWVADGTFKSAVVSRRELLKAAWNFGCLCNMLDFSRTENLQVSAVAEMHGLGQWFTEGNVEKAG